MFLSSWLHRATSAKRGGKRRKERGEKEKATVWYASYKKRGKKKKGGEGKRGKGSYYGLFFAFANGVGREKKGKKKEKKKERITHACPRDWAARAQGVNTHRRQRKGRRGGRKKEGRRKGKERERKDHLSHACSTPLL